MALTSTYGGRLSIGAQKNPARTSDFLRNEKFSGNEVRFFGDRLGIAPVRSWVPADSLGGLSGGDHQVLDAAPNVVHGDHMRSNPTPLARATPSKPLPSPIRRAEPTLEQAGIHPAPTCSCRPRKPKRGRPKSVSASTPRSPCWTPPSPPSFAANAAAQTPGSALAVSVHGVGSSPTSCEPKPACLMWSTGV